VGSYVFLQLKAPRLLDYLEPTSPLDRGPLAEETLNAVESALSRGLLVNSEPGSPRDWKPLAREHR
jgi:hypothetical protein